MSEIDCHSNFIQIGSSAVVAQLLICVSRIFMQLLSIRISSCRDNIKRAS